MNNWQLLAMNIKKSKQNQTIPQAYKPIKLNNGFLKAVKEQPTRRMQQQ